MRKLTSLFTVLLVIPFGCTTPEVKVPECKPVTAVTADGECTTSPKLKLTAADFRLPTEGQFEWSFYAFKDVASINTIPKYEWTSFTDSNMLTVPDSVLKNNSVVLVRIGSLCNGKRLESLAFRFIKEKSANSSCEA